MAEVTLVRGQTGTAEHPHLRHIMLCNHLLSGHLGFLKMFRCISKKYICAGMPLSISRYIHSCLPGQVYKPQQQKPVGFMESTWATEPMVELSVDRVGLLPTATWPSCHLMTISDMFMKFIKLHLLQTSTSKIVLDRLLETCHHRFPKGISSHNGNIFVGNP